MVELRAAHDAKDGVAIEGVSLTVVEQPRLAHFEVARLQRQPQVSQDVVAQVGDTAAAQLVARVNGLIDDDDAPGPGRVAPHQVQRRGRARRAGADN